jgi:hypothetical protein
VPGYPDPFTDNVGNGLGFFGPGGVNNQYCSHTASLIYRVFLSNAVFRFLSFAKITPVAIESISCFLVICRAVEKSNVLPGSPDQTGRRTGGNPR